MTAAAKRFYGYSPLTTLKNATAIKSKYSHRTLILLAAAAEHEWGEWTPSSSPS